MPIITKPSEALKLALTVMARPESPWSSYNPKRGGHQYTCNALDYLAEAEEITDEAKEAALKALYPHSDMVKDPEGKPLVNLSWFFPYKGENLDDAQARRIAAINLTIQQLEEKGQ